MSFNFKDITEYSLIQCVGSSGIATLQVKSKCKIPFGIILPSMYHIKIANLPVENEYKAKKLANAVFDGFLPKHKTFKYVAKKLEKGKFCLIAYCEEDIFELLKNANSNTLVWLFAQFCIKDSAEIGSSAIFIKDDILLELPKSLVNEKFKNSAQAKCDILKSILYFQKPKNLTQSILTISLIALILSFAMQSFMYATSITQAFLESSKTSQNATANQDGIDAKIAELQIIASKQNAIRKSFDLFAQTKSIAKLESMKYENSKLSAVFLTQNQAKFKNIITPFNPQAVVISGDSVSIQLQIGEQ